MIPTYRFQCLACGVRFVLPREYVELDEPAECPYCGNTSAVRASAPAADRVSPLPFISGPT